MADLEGNPSNTVVACCEQFGKELGTSLEDCRSDEMGFCVPGCCGGGCYVLQNMKFCPFCGTEIK